MLQDLDAIKNHFKQRASLKKKHARRCIEWTSRRHPLREVEGLRVRASFTTVVWMTVSIGNERLCCGLGDSLVVLSCLRNVRNCPFRCIIVDQNLPVFLGSLLLPLLFMPSHTHVWKLLRKQIGKIIQNFDQTVLKVSYIFFPGSLRGSPHHEPGTSCRMPDTGILAEPQLAIQSRKTGQRILWQPQW